MNDIVAGLMDQVWVIEGYDGTTEIFSERFPVAGMSEAEVSRKLTDLASKHLTPAEIERGFARVKKDESSGNRITLTAGDNPHYVASLFRPDELAERD